MTMTALLRRSIVLALGVALTGSCSSSSASAPPGPAEIRGLLIGKEALPAQTNWGLAVDAERVTRDPVLCDDQVAEFDRSWNQDGEQFAQPQVLQFLCIYETSEQAAKDYEERTLASSAGEDYLNFESEPSNIVPTEWTASSVAADQAEVGCAEGNADGLCSVWIFRARYGDMITQVTFRGSLMFFADFLMIVRSADRRLQSPPKA